MGFASFSFGLVTAIAAKIPEFDPAHQQRIALDGYVYAGDGHTILAVLRGSQARVLVPSNRIAPVMKHAIVDVEDKRFYEHRGVDLHGILRAVVADLRHQKIVQGGSTITQQFVKNTYVSSHRSLTRKLMEAAFAWQLEQQWSKDRILTAYLNTIYFGNGAYGIEQASQTYFHHSALKLTLPEAALLAGIPSDPSQYDPVTNPRAARDRREVVLADMLDQADITRAQYDRAVRAPMPRGADVKLPRDRGLAPYFVNYVKQQLVDRYGSGRVFGGGLRVYTTIDLRLQRMARAAISKWLTDPNGPSAALVALDPRDGRVLAMFGGSNFRKSQFNLAVQGERQPGSAFKPFVLATALREGISPSTTFDSHQVTINAGGRLWEVHNYEGEYLGPITVETATTVSDNSVFAQLTSVVGPANVVKTARLLGIQSRLLPYFSIGLGAQAVNPLEMARAFAGFADEGRRIDGRRFGNEPRVVEKVENAKRRPVDDNRPLARQVLSRNDAAIVTNLLESVIKSGTGKEAQLPDGRPEAGKTGTTENFGDAWFVGYVPQLVVAVWVGYPNKLQPMLTEFHGQPVAGGTYPALIWKAFMEQALPYLNAAPDAFPSPSFPYASPKNVVLRDGKLKLDNGVCTNTVQVEYFGGEGPQNIANCKPNEVEVPRVIGQTASRAKARLAAQPLEAAFVYRPAEPRQRLGVVLNQYPAGGTLSSHDKVTLVLAKPLHGVVPRVVGLTLRQAETKLERLRLDVHVSPDGADSSARVLAQSPRAGVAAAPGLEVKLVTRG